MKSPSLLELEKIVTWSQPLVGLRLQEALVSDSDIVLGFYSRSGLLWLWADLNPIQPWLLPWSSLPFTPPARKTPMGLFLRAHFVGRTLTSVELSKEHGRVVELRFGAGPEEARLEFRLFPHGANFIAFDSDKKIAWRKPRPLSEPIGTTEVSPPRDLETLRSAWAGGRSRPSGAGKKTKATQDPKIRVQKEIEKKEKALAKVREELERKRQSPWRAAGEWMKSHQSLAVPGEWEPLIDRRRKLSWNIENCFTRAREIEGKVAGTENRVAVLQREIETLRSRLEGALPLAEKSAGPPRLSPIQNTDVRARTLKLDPFTVIAGKSAADNLKILRRARAWDLWFHLRDYPSQHAVLFRNKNETVRDDQLREVAAWFVREHFGAKLGDHRGEKFELIIAECRHVRPIKGDRLGRVTYRDERILIYQVPS